MWPSSSSNDLLGAAEPVRQREALADLSRPETLRGVLEAILASDSSTAEVGAASFTHPLGFDKYVLHSRYPSGQLRLHVWWPGERRHAEHIHNHRFSFSSAVVAGTLRTHVYRATVDGTPMSRYRDASVMGAGRWGLEESGSLPVDCALSTTMTAGSTYSMSADTLHRIVPTDGLTVTLFLETSITRDHSCVLIEPGRRPAGPVRREPFGAEGLRVRLGNLIASMM